jgi:hypothetical protein
MKTRTVSLILLSTLLATPLILTGCGGGAAAGAATYAAYDNRQDEQKKEDLANHRSDVKDKRGDRER